MISLNRCKIYLFIIHAKQFLPVKYNSKAPSFKVNKNHEFLLVQMIFRQLQTTASKLTVVNDFK